MKLEPTGSFLVSILSCNFGIREVRTTSTYKRKIIVMKYEQKHVIWFVKGAVVDYHNAMRSSSSPYEMESHSLAVLDTVLRYLNGSIELDGRCSDLECDLALQAKKIFLKKDEVQPMVSTPSSVFEAHGYMKRLFSSKEDALKYGEDYGDDNPVEYPLLCSYEEAVVADNNMIREAALRKLTEEEKKLLGLTL